MSENENKTNDMFYNQSQVVTTVKKKKSIDLDFLWAN